jgi:hypothetical protein
MADHLFFSFFFDEIGDGKEEEDEAELINSDRSLNFKEISDPRSIQSRLVDQS